MIQMKRKMNMSQEYKIRLGSKRRVPKGMYVNRRERKKERAEYSHKYWTLEVGRKASK